MDGRTQRWERPESQNNAGRATVFVFHVIWHTEKKWAVMSVDKIALTNSGVVPNIQSRATCVFTQAMYIPLHL
jgi:hypothetical protein